DDAGRVDQIEVGAGNCRPNRAVDIRNGAARHPADHVADRPIASGRGEGGAFVSGQTKLPEAVEKIASDLSAEAGADRVTGTGQGRSVDRDVLRRCDLRR